MQYTPRYSQPFSLEQAIGLDTSVITEEITRLQNSLIHLTASQDILRDDIASSNTPDPDVVQAFQENKDVIGSQEERISMLQLALTHKGVTYGSHYDSAAPGLGATTQSNGNQSESNVPVYRTPADTSSHANGEDAIEL